MNSQIWNLGIITIECRNSTPYPLADYALSPFLLTTDTTSIKVIFQAKQWKKYIYICQMAILIVVELCVSSLLIVFVFLK